MIIIYWLCVIVPLVIIVAIVTDRFTNWEALLWWLTILTFFACVFAMVFGFTGLMRHYAQSDKPAQAEISK